MSNLEQQVERLLNAMERNGNNPSAGSSAGGNTDSRPYKERMDDLIKTSKEAGDSFKKLNGGLKLTSRAQFEHRAAMKEASNELYELEVALTKHRKGTNLLTDSQLKAVEARRKELAGMMQQGQASEKLIGLVGQAGKFMIGYVSAIQQVTLQGIGQVLSTIQSGGSGFAIANAQMAMNLDIANTHVQQLAAGAQLAGGAIAMIPGVASKVVGLAVMLGAEAKKASSQLQTDAQKMFNQLLMAGGDQLLNSYVNLTRTGAVLANGADSIRDALAVGGTMQISFQTFEKMLAGNTELLANSNMGMAAATEMLAKVGAKLKSQGVDKGLQALGIGLEETGAVIATVMRDIARQGKTVTQKEVEQQTVEYAKNLALMASLSGKTVKEELAKRQAAQSEFGYRARMMQMGIKADSEMAKVMENLSPSVRAAIVEIDRYGHIRNEEVRNLAQLMPEYGEYLSDMARLFGGANITLKQEMDLRAKLGPKLQNSMKNNPLLTDLAIARTKLEAPLNNFMEEFDRTMRSNATTVEKQMAIIEEQYLKGLQAKLDDKSSLTSVLLSMKSIGEEFQAKFQDEIIHRIPEIATKLKEALDQAAALIKKGPSVNTSKLDATYDLAKQVGILAAAWMTVSLAIRGIKALLPGPKPGGAPTATTANTTTTESARTTAGPKAMTPEQQRVAEQGMRASERQRFRAEQAALRASERASAEAAAKTEAELAKRAARDAKIVKYAKIAKGGTALLQVGMYGKDMIDIAAKKDRGEIDERQANMEYTGKTVETAGGLMASFLGAKIGAAIGAGIGVFFGGVGAVPGAAVGGLLGAIFGGAVYYLTSAGDWVNKTFQKASAWWQDQKVTEKVTNLFKGIWNGTESVMTWIGEKFSWSNIKSMFGQGDSSPATRTARNDGTPSAVPVSTQVMASLPSGLKVLGNGGLGVSFVTGGNAVDLTAGAKTVLTEAFTTALRNAQGGAGSLNTTSFSTGFYKPKLNPQGKAVTEADFAEIGKGDPVVYALGKLTKIAAESASDMRSLASKMGASLDTQSDSKRYLKNMAGAFR
jgi:hypothetical protein